MSLKHNVHDNIYELKQTDDNHYMLIKNGERLVKIRSNKDNEPILKDIDKYIDGKITEYEKTHSHQTLEELKEVKLTLQSFQGDLVNEKEHKESIFGKFIETFLSKVNQRYEKAFDSVRDDKYNTNFKPDETGNKVSIEQNMTLPKLNQEVIKVAYNGDLNEIQGKGNSVFTSQQPNLVGLNRKLLPNEANIIDEDLSQKEQERKQNKLGKLGIHGDSMKNITFSKIEVKSDTYRPVAGLNTSTPPVGRGI